MLTPAGSVTDGNSGANYAVTFINNTTGVITAKPLAVTATGVNKQYDATTATTVTLADNRVSGDVLTTAYTTASFVDKNVANGKTINVSGISISGTDSGNYTPNTTTTTTANITPAPLTLTAVTNTKTADGNTSAAAIPTVLGLLGSDTVSDLTETYDNFFTGSSKVLSVATYTVNDGNGGLNYSVSTVTDNTGVISDPVSSGGGGGSRARVRVTTGSVATTPAPGAVLGAAKFNFTFLLRQGAVGAEVMELQKFLNGAGFGPLVVDGKFGPITRAAVVRFQLANGLVGDGIVGPLTRAVLNK